MKYLVFYIITILIIFFSSKTEVYNWDVLPYVASALSYNSDLDHNQIHKKVYGELKEVTSNQMYFTLTDNNSNFRKRMYADPELFALQLPYYQPRVVYNALIALMESFGINPFFATRLISAIAVFFALALIATILFSNMRMPAIGCIFPILLLPIGLSQTILISTPDGLAFFMTVLAGYFFINKRIISLLIIFPLLILVRTDLIILIACFAGYFVLLNRKHIIGYSISFIISLQTYSLLNSYYGHYGWNTLIYNTFIDAIINPVNFDTAVTPAIYIKIFTYGLSAAYHNPIFSIYAVLCSAILVCHMKIQLFKNITTQSNHHLLAIFHYINIAYLFIHFVAFPGLLDRFFISQYTTGMLLAVYLAVNLTCKIKHPTLKSPHA